jgi:hypothetical protein
MPHMEVIGADGESYLVPEEIVRGAIMGYSGPMGDYEGSAITDLSGSVMGYDEYGEPILEGARHVRRGHARGRHPVIVKKPGWRAGQLAPGVIAPDQGLLPLPMPGRPSNTFDSTITSITFEGQIQKPFRGERLLVRVVRTGVTAVGILQSQLFVGTDLQQLDVQGFDAESVGDPAAFGVRLTMKPAQPGVFIRLVTVLSSALVAPDTIFVSCTILGRNVH